MTERYCTSEEVEKEKREFGGGRVDKKGEVELHLSFSLSGDP